jgi:hypothetical protein
MLQVAAGVVDRLHHPNLAERLPMREAREHLCALVKRSADSLVASGCAALTDVFVGVQLLVMWWSTVYDPALPASQQHFKHQASADGLTGQVPPEVVRTLVACE